MDNLPFGLDPSMIPSAAPPPGVTSNFQDPPNLAQVIIAVSAIASALAALSLAARLYSTLRVTRSPGLDDFSCIFAFALSMAYTGLVLSTKDYARHAWDLAIISYTAKYLKIILAETLVGALALFFSKVSILLLLFRVFSTKRRTRLFIYFGIVWAALIGCTALVVACALCIPRGNESFDSLPSIERCTHQEIWAVVQGALNVALDLYILYLPIPLVLALQLGLKKKLGVLAIFMTGLIACVASITSLGYKIKLVQSSDVSWNSYRVDILNIVEINTAILVASMPACFSCFRHLFSSLKSYIETRYNTTGSDSSSSILKRTSYHIDSAPRPAHYEPNHPSPTYLERGGQSGKYWRLRDWLGGGDYPPQITAVTRQSRTLQSGDLNVLEEKCSV